MYKRITNIIRMIKDRIETDTDASLDKEECQVGVLKIRYRGIETSVPLNTLDANMIVQEFLEEIAETLEEYNTAV